eukprot:4361539-Pyramimonas_sp.AAC.1
MARDVLWAPSDLSLLNVFNKTSCAMATETISSRERGREKRRSPANTSAPHQGGSLSRLARITPRRAGQT